MSGTVFHLGFDPAGLALPLQPAVAAMGRPFDLRPWPGRAEVQGPALAWLDLGSTEAPEQARRFDQALAALGPGRPGLALTLPGPPPESLTARLGRGDVVLVLAEPLEGQAEARGWLWLGPLGPGQSDSGAFRLAKAFSRLLQSRPVVNPWGRPEEAMVEVVRACNLRCPLCPVGNGQAEMYPPLKPAVFRRLAGQLAPTVWRLALHNYGEPLLHPDLPELVAAAKAEGLEVVEIVTNGNVLRPGLAEGLVAAGLDFMRFSVDGATQATYARYRVGGDLATVWANLRAVRAARERLGLSRPVLEAQFVVSRFNESELESFKAAALAQGADQYRIKTFNAFMSGPAKGQEGRGFLPLDRRLSRYRDYADLALASAFRLARCEWPARKVVVNADGTVVPCCYDYNGRHTLGRVDLAGGEWWATPARAEFRRRLAEDPLAIEMCAHCPVGVPDLSVQAEETGSAPAAGGRS